jgi:hypothetical protein
LHNLALCIRETHLIVFYQKIPLNIGEKIYKAAITLANIPCSIFYIACKDITFSSFNVEFQG